MKVLRFILGFLIGLITPVLSVYITVGIASPLLAAFPDLAKGALAMPFLWTLGFVYCLPFNSFLMGLPTKGHAWWKGIALFIQALPAAYFVFYQTTNDTSAVDPIGTEGLEWLILFVLIVFIATGIAFGISNPIQKAIAKRRVGL
jgi:hypothetical protein